MIKKLTRKKLITYNKTAGAVLTRSGMKLALRMVRRHRLWERFLHEKLDYGWEEVHDIAEQLEHVQGNNLADRLDKYLGYPRFDPHGEAIPGANGKMEKISGKALYDVRPGTTCKVVSIKDTSTLFLQYLDRLKIEIGTVIKINEKIAFDGSLIIRVKDNTAMVTPEFAKSILVD